MSRKQMQQHNLGPRTVLTALLLLAAGTGLAFAQTPAAGGGPREGITVHGHWEIEVRNPDGSLALRREFENALVDTGKRVLARVLYGATIPGRWTIFASNPCAGDPCFIVPFGSSANAGLSQNLLVELTALDNILLSGSFTALAPGSIQQVGTMLVSCFYQAGAEACAPELGLVRNPAGLTIGNADLFTTTNIQPVAILAGQIVQIRVTLSFS